MRLSRLFALALIAVLLHTLTNGQHGFHRDELATLDDARYLAWGYVAYPPVTPFIARMALDLFGASLAGVRHAGILAGNYRSEERRVGKECRSRWSPYH